MSYISPELAEEIYKFLSGDRTLELFKEKFCSDVSEYMDSVLVLLEYNFYRGGSWSEDVLLNADEWEQLDDNTIIHLGEVNGKHSDVSIELHRIVKDVITDPYAIGEYVDHHSVMDEYSVLHCAFSEY